MGRGMGRGMDANICIACLRQVVAFAPKVIKCAVGAIKGNKMRLKPKGFIESSTLGAIMNGRRYGRRDCKRYVQ